MTFACSVAWHPAFELGKCLFSEPNGKHYSHSSSHITPSTRDAEWRARYCKCVSLDLGGIDFIHYVTLTPTDRKLCTEDHISETVFTSVHYSHFTSEAVRKLAGISLSRSRFLWIINGSSERLLQSSVHPSRPSDALAFSVMSWDFSGTQIESLGHSFSQIGAF